MARSELSKQYDRLMGIVSQVLGLNEEERGFVLDRVAPEPQTKDKSKPATTQRRKIEKCVACNWTRRAAVHKDSSLSDYHEFQASNGATSAGAVKKRGLPVVGVDGPCAVTGCAEVFDNPIHDKSFGYAGYHPFVPAGGSTTAPVAAKRSSRKPKPSEVDPLSVVSSETDMEGASIAAGAGS